MSPLLVYSLVLVSLLFLKLVQIIFWEPSKIQRHFRNQGVSGPPYRPLVGNSVEVQRMYDAALSKPMLSSPLDSNIIDRVMPHYTTWAAEYGKTFLFWSGLKPVVALSEPALIKEVLMNSDGTFSIIQLNPLVKLWVGNGLVFLEGEKWVSHRRIANQAFTMERVKSWIDEMVESARKMMDNWERIRAGREEMEIELQKEFADLCADIISRTAFGSNYEEGKCIFELHQQHSRLVIPTIKKVYIPGFRFIPTKANREMWRLEKEARESIHAHIKKQNTQHSRNFLSLLMSASNNKEGRLDIDQVVEECKTFYFVGKEITATALTWVLVLLSAHPEWQDKAREEVLSVCGDSGFPTADNINELNMISMIVNEALRLYAPAVFVKRKTTKRAKLGTLSIPVGTEVHLAVAAVHRDKEIWGEDADDFNPLRFLRTVPAGAYLPFGLGPRYCVGKSMALVELRVILAMVVRAYSFRLSPAYVHAPIEPVILQPQCSAEVLVRKVV